MSENQKKNFVIYRSSAGSGKTFTLVLQYLRLALHDKHKLKYHFKRILAITFTNKAAGEMKERIILSLERIVKDKQMPDIGIKLCELLSIDHIELRERSRVLLNSILHNYSDLGIGTIDSFTHKIVKTFAYDLKLPVNFNIETDLDTFYQKVIYELLGKIGEDDYVTEVLRNFSLEKAEDNSNWDPEKGIFQFINLFKKEDSQKYIDLLKDLTEERLETVKEQLRGSKQEYENVIANIGIRAEELRKHFGLNSKEFFNAGSGTYNVFIKCYQKKYDEIDVSRPTFLKCFHESKWIPKDPRNSEISAALNQLATELIDHLEKHQAHYLLVKLLYRNIHQLMLVRQIDAISREKKQEETLVFISEFNQKIFDLINHEPTPYIYERIGERYMHYLVDEFQDTSSMQWHNLLPLIDNSLANGWFNMVVGDGKQSIYRWRNADVKQFAMLPEIENSEGSNVVAEREASLKRNYAVEQLTTNYRSSSTVVDFNNQLFDQISERLLDPSLKSIYHHQAQLAKSTSLGYITLHPGKAATESVDDFHYLKTIEAVQAAIEDGYSYRDICILIRKNTAGSKIAEHFMKHNIPVVSSDSLLLKNNLEVNTLVAFLSYLHNEDDQISAASVINYLRYSGKTDEDSFTAHLKQLSGKSSLYKILQDRGIDLDPSELLLKNLLDICIEVSEKLNLHHNNHLYIRFFLDEVSEFLTTRNSSLGRFLTWWETRRNKASLIIQDNSNAIKIMTIHASKGLEFPVVIMPFCNWKIRSDDNAWVNIEEDDIDLPVSVVTLNSKTNDTSLGDQYRKEHAEQTLDNLNLLYVAFTRAVDRLHVISLEGEKNHHETINKWLLKYMEDNYTLSPSGFYEIGQKAKATTHHKKNNEQYPIGELEFADLTQVIKIKPAFSSQNMETEKARRDGIILHRILSEIETIEDVDSIMETQIIRGYVNRELAAELREKILLLLNTDELRKYYSKEGNTKNEREMITENGEILRPDKIYISEDSATIIDYKTGERNDKKYALQLNKYAEALQQMGISKIKKLLVYTSDCVTIEC